MCFEVVVVLFNSILVLTSRGFDESWCHKLKGYAAPTFYVESMEKKIVGKKSKRVCKVDLHSKTNQRVLLGSDSINLSNLFHHFSSSNLLRQSTDNGSFLSVRRQTDDV